MFNIVSTVENFARANGVAVIDTLVLQVGELSPVVPQYLHACYPAAVDGTLLQDTQLKIEMVPGNVRCEDCGATYNLLQEQRVCPQCCGQRYAILSGREFLIKEIVAR